MSDNKNMFDSVDKFAAAMSSGELTDNGINSSDDSNNIKVVRQNAIIGLIKEEEISTQNELLQRLKDMGFAVTQATISRDIRELRLIKVAKSDGGYRYAQNKPKNAYQTTDHFHSMFATGVYNVDFANNLVVIKCYAGMAQAVCVIMDGLEFPGIVGTLSGDDTILVVMRDNNSAAKLVKELKSIPVEE